MVESGALKPGNGDALTAGIGALCRSAALRGDGDAAIASLPLRIIAGIELTTRGISFHPFVPQAFGGVKRLTGIIYRDSEIDITVRGTGCTIDTFSDSTGASRPNISFPPVSYRAATM